MEIKIECACGQPFEFDVEPENGRMPCEINCPACGASATAQANDFISRQISPKPAVIPVQPAPPAAIRINRSFTPPTSAPAAPSRMAPLPSRTATQPSQPRNNSFLKGLAGALIAAIVGMLGWFLLIKVTGVEIGYAAWGVGAITGLGARLAGGEGGSKLGLMAGLFALMAIIGGQFLAVKSFTQKEIDKEALTTYQDEMDFAKQAMAAGTIAETKAMIAKHFEEDVSDVTDEKIDNLREFIAGKPSQAEYIRTVNKSMQAITNTFSMQFEMLKAGFSLFTLLWIFLGVSSAYKIGSGRN
jgi:hypothetical protein